MANVDGVFRGTKGDPWFDDGNIVLVTEDKQTAFKVHRGVVARHSEVFKSMFELPPPDSLAPSEVLDGCPVVPMYDNPVELSNLVKALYDGPDFTEEKLEDFYYLASILRLSSKYFISHLRKDAISFLSKTWCYTLEGHDRMVEQALSRPLVDDLSYPYVHPIHILNLAREVNVRLVIPSALYFLSLYRLDDLLREDHPKLQFAHPSRPSSTLNVHDIKDYTLVFQFRINAILDFSRQFCAKRAPAPLCTTVTDCSKAFARLYSRLSKSWFIRTGPLHYMLQAIHELDHDGTACGPCRVSFNSDVAALRKQIWDELPSVIGFPTWTELIALDLGS